MSNWYIVGHLSFEAEDKGEKQEEGSDVYSHRGHTETNCTFSGFDKSPLPFTMDAAIVP